MALLTKQIIGPAGATPAYVAAAGGGDTVQPGDHTFLHVKNGGGAPITVTIDDPTSVSPPGASQFNPDLSVSVTNAQERMIGPLTARFANPATGLVNITYSGVTTVTVGAFQI